MGSLIGYEAGLMAFYSREAVRTINNGLEWGMEWGLVYSMFQRVVRVDVHRLNCGPEDRDIPGGVL